MPYHPDCPHCAGTREHLGKGCPARRRSGKRLPRSIRAWDCETVGEKIVLFLHASQNRDAVSLYNSEGLKTADVFSWMIETGAKHLNIAFFFDFDVNQLLRQLPAAHLEQLRARGRVTWRRWTIRHVPGKRFSLSDRVTRRSITIWDVKGWTQCSFVKLITDWNLGTPDEREYVRAMKAKRSDLSQVSKEDLIRYTTLECALLSEWMHANLTLHEKMEIKLRSYSGAGSSAAALLRSHGWKPPEVPAEVQRIAEIAYYGGRSETSRIGPAAGPIYSYDIRSAHPAAMVNLPEIAGAKWRRCRRFIAGAWGFYHVRWNQPPESCWGLFPVRGAVLPSGRRSLSLLYPLQGQGWYHSAEVEAALEVAPDAVEIISGYVIEPAGAPFAWVADVAAERLARKQRNDPAQLPLKVAINSLYGKLAQHAGQHPMQCLTYAAAITASTRAQLLRLMVPAGHDVILVATDGILSRRPLPVSIGESLGQWEIAQYPDAWILQAGVYWAGAKVRTRGIDGRTLKLSEVETMWRTHQTSAALTIETARVLSYRIACARGKPHLTGTWETTTRTVRFTPQPRRRAWRMEDGALLTLPAHVRDYRIQQMFDEISLLLTPEQDYSDTEALPDWSFDE